jgi:hypothetical protein
MQSFSSVLRRYYPRVFLSNLLGLFTIYLIMGITTFLIGLFLLPSLIESGLLEQLNMNEIDPEVLRKLLNMVLPGVIVFGLVLLIVGIFWAAGIVGSSVVAVCQDRPSVGAFFSQGFRNFFRMLGLGVLLVITFIPAIILFIVFLVYLVMNKLEMALTFLFLSAIVGAFIYIMFMFAPFMMIADNEKVFRSMSQSFQQFRSRFGYVFVTGLVVIGVMFLQGILTRILQNTFGPNSNITFALGALFDTVLSTFSNLFIAHRYQNRLRGELYPGRGPGANADWQGQGSQAHSYNESPQPQGPAAGYTGYNPQGQAWQQPSQPSQPSMGSQSVSWGQPNQWSTGNQSGTWGQSQQPPTPPSSGSGAQSAGAAPQQPARPQFQSPFQPSFTFNPGQQQGKPSWQVPQPSQPQSQPAQQPQPEKPGQPPRYPRQQ